MKEVETKALVDIGLCVFAILRNVKSVLEGLPSPVRKQIQPHLDANDLWLARIGKNLKELGVGNENEQAS